MIMLIKTLAAIAAGTVLATNAFAQSTREIRDASPYAAIENESPPKLIVDPTPLATGLAHHIRGLQMAWNNIGKWERLLGTTRAMRWCSDICAVKGFNEAGPLC